MRKLKAADVEKVLKRGGPTLVESDVEPRFKPGDSVRTRNLNPAGHTRLPRYARAKRGVVHQGHGTHVFPDSHAAGLGKNPQHLYSIRFEAEELFGPDCERREAVYIDLWESYLEPA